MALGGICLALIMVAVLYERSPVARLRGTWFYQPIGSTRRRAAGLGQAIVPLDVLPRAFLLSVLMAEDRHFFQHRGFDWREMRIAIFDWLFHGARLRGASTISQQLMKNFFLSPRRSFRRKLREAVYTVKLERRFTKEEILTLYLNHIEWGCGIYGIREAANHYFRKAPSELDEVEGLFLVALIPRPRIAREIPATTWRTFRALGTYFHALGATAEVQNYLAGRGGLRALDLKGLQFGGDGEARKIAARAKSAEMVEAFRARVEYVRNRRHHSSRR